MPRVDPVSADTATESPYGDPGRVAASGLSLFPFRGLRYVPERVGSLAAVTSPPYDVVDPERLRRLETADPYNVVRLTLPRAPGGVAAGYRRAASLLAGWQRSGVLAADPDPALYVYEQRLPPSAGGGLQRGLIGALALSGPEAGVVLPHEDVMPQPVADRVGLMRTTKANLEPLLLTYRGDGRAADVVERSVEAPPLLATETADGTRHRLWAVTDPARLAAVTADLSTCRALIADGHHRWAMYLRLQREHRYLARSPWDRGLVLLVDTARYPLQVKAIHRVLFGLPPERALAALGPEWRRTDLDGSLTAALDRLAAAKAAGENAFVLAGNGRYCLLSTTLETLEQAGEQGPLPKDRPEEWRRLDASLLHTVLLDRVWHVPDTPEAIGYLHDAAAAVREAHRTDGTAVLLHPVPESTVWRLAEKGIRMPRKSTSFGPKPATGLVIRSLLLD
jgi:uncharacterized protein (DUF1015 family)